MEETHNFFERVPPTDPDATIVNEHDPTLATPRFDAGEAHEARPVVPITHNAYPRRRSRWPIALVLVSALVGGAISIFAFRVYQQRQTAATRAGAQPQTVTQTAPQQLPSSLPDDPSPVVNTASATAEKPQPQAPVVIETVETEKATEKASAPKKDESAARKVAAADETKTGRKEDRKVEEKRVAERGGGETRPRLVETIRAPRRADEDMRRDDRADDTTDVLRDERQARRRERREQRRNNNGDGGQRRNIDRIKDIFQGPPPA